MTQVTLRTSFFRNIISSSLATGCDYMVMLFFTEIIGFYYVYSVAIGNIFGAIVSFLLGRYWVFESTNKNMVGQAFKYALSSFVIMLFNVAGVYILTEYLQIDYRISKAIVTVFVGVFISFGLFRFFVFK